MLEEELAPAGVFRWQGPVRSAIQTFRPIGNPPAWPRVEAEVQRIVTEAGPIDPAQARYLMGLIARLAIFADDEGYRPAKAPVLLTPDLIGKFVHKVNGHLSPGTRRGYERTLLRLRDIMLGDANRIKQPKLSAADDHQPYTLAEMASLWSWTAGQPTERLRHGCRVIVTLVRGCGIEGGELIEVCAHDLRRAADHEGPVYLRVRGPGERVVVCRRRWEDALYTEARAFAGQDQYLFQPRSHARTTSLITAFLAQTHPAPATPALKLSRLRATWLVDLIEARLPLPVLLAAAGPKTLKLLGRVLPYLSNVAGDEATRLLRGEAQ
jgi:hypothetical protein